MTTYRKKILNRLMSLSEIDGVTVDLSDEKKSIDIKYKSQHSLDFFFKWVDGNHFAGYFVDSDQNKSQAVISLWKPMDAIQFTASYALLIELRAKREPPEDMK